MDTQDNVYAMRQELSSKFLELDMKIGVLEARDEERGATVRALREDVASLKQDVLELRSLALRSNVVQIRQKN